VMNFVRVQKQPLPPGFWENSIFARSTPERQLSSQHRLFSDRQRTGKQPNVPTSLVSV
jgi:hypothetical protein